MESKRCACCGKAVDPDCQITNPERRTCGRHGIRAIGSSAGKPTRSTVSAIGACRTSGTLGGGEHACLQRWTCQRVKRQYLQVQADEIVVSGDTATMKGRYAALAHAVAGTKKWALP